jgi:CheY-like chemotaxis protein
LSVRILVIDDYVQVEVAVRSCLDEGAHEVEGVRDPRDLPEFLAVYEPFDLALVDMDFGHGAPSGLAALRILRERSPRTRTVVNSADSEVNRLLYLFAAFMFFDPLTILSKAASQVAIQDLVSAIADGRPPAREAATPYVPTRPPEQPVLDRLVRNGTELMLWREISRFERRSEVARAAYVDERTVDRFTANKSPIVAEIAGRFHAWEDWGAEARYEDAVEERSGRSPHAPNLIRLSGFARTHQRFFRDREVADLFAARWRGAQHPNRSNRAGTP